MPPKRIRRTRGDVTPSGGPTVGEPDPKREERGVRGETARLTERDPLPLHRDARQASVDVGLEGVQFGGMGPGQDPGLARCVLLEGQDPVPDRLGMGGGRTSEPDGQRNGGHGRAPAAIPAEEPADYSLSS